MTGWQKGPFEIKVKAGESVAFCMCGKSKNGPYCDGSHKGSGITPKLIKFEKETTVFACGCQQSNKRPFCDGTHKDLMR
jgi:CDGSH-type Zn-finger protein